MNIVARVTSNSAMVAGVFVPRPSSMASSDWREFWERRSLPQHMRVLINFDAFRAMVFGAVIPKPPTVTQAEWSAFWQERSDRPSLAVTNRNADDAFIRESNRTARKPIK